MLIIALLLVFNSCQVNTTSRQQAGVLASNNQSFTLSISHPFHQMKLEPLKSQRYHTGQRLSLQLNGPKLKVVPEGVYELYLSTEPLMKEAFHANSKHFVTVLDLYTLTDQKELDYLAMDITNTIETLLKDETLLPPLVVTLLFRGNGLPNNGESKNAGEITFTGIFIIE